MTLVAWILALVGAGLALAICGGGSMGVERSSGLAALPLPAMAVYFTAADLVALVRAGPPYEGLVFTGGPFLIGLLTVFGVFWAGRPRSRET